MVVLPYRQSINGEKNMLSVNDIKRLKAKGNSLMVKHGTKLAIGAGTVALAVQSASADITSDALNGSTMIGEGIKLMAIPPFSYLIGTIIVAYGLKRILQVVRIF